jgi:hypothetical protein
VQRWNIAREIQGLLPPREAARIRNQHTRRHRQGAVLLIILARQAPCECVNHGSRIVIRRQQRGVRRLLLVREARCVSHGSSTRLHRRRVGLLPNKREVQCLNHHGSARLQRRGALDLDLTVFIYPVKRLGTLRLRRGVLDPSYGIIRPLRQRGV